MGLSRPTKRAVEFRCEGCAYALSATPGSSSCPECGKPIAESLPSSRPGVPWQRRPSVYAWMVTVWHVMVAPRRAARSLRIEARLSAAMLAANLAAGSAFTVATAFLAWRWGPRDLSYRSGPNTTTIIMDESVVSGVLFGVAFPLLVLASVAGVAAWYAPRRDPPMPAAAVWANQSLVTAVFPLVAFVYLAAYIAWRTIVPAHTMDTPTPAIRFLLLAPPFVLFGGLAWAAYLDWLIGRVNRFANPASTSIPIEKPSDDRHA